MVSLAVPLILEGSIFLIYRLLLSLVCPLISMSGDYFVLLYLYLHSNFRTLKNMIQSQENMKYF